MNQTERFLDLLAGVDAVYCWQVLPPNDKLRKELAWWGTWKRKEPALRRANDKGYGVFITIQNLPRNQEGRRKQKYVTGYRAICLDDDTVRDGPRDDLPLPPSMIVESSAGKYHYWYLATQEIDVELGRRMMRGAAELCGTDPMIASPQSVLRVPGFDHTKRGRFPVTLVEDEGFEYTPEELEAAFPPQAEQPAPRRRRGSAEIPTWLEVRDGDAPDGGVPVVCPFVDHSTHNAIYWLPSDQNNNAGGFSCLHPTCQDRGIGDVFRYGTRKGLDKLVFVEPENRFRYLDMPGETGPSRAALATSYAGKHTDIQGGDGKLLTALQYLPRLPTVRTVRFAPEYDPGVTGDMLNTYLPRVHPATGGTVEPFLEFMEHLVPEPREREIVLDWLAWKVKQPWMRLHFLVMVAKEVFGTGRGTLANILRDLYGYVEERNMDIILGKNSQSVYNDYLSSSLFTVISETLIETSVSAQLAAYEAIKDQFDTTPSQKYISRKYGHNSKEWVVTTGLFCTNHGGGVAIPHDCRRSIVVANGPAMGDNHPIHKWRRDPENIGALYRWLRARECQAYRDIVGTPPATPAKRNMISTSEPIITRCLRETMERLPFPVFHVSQIKAAVAYQAKVVHGVTLPDRWVHIVDNMIGKYSEEFGRKTIDGAKRKLHIKAGAAEPQQWKEGVSMNGKITDEDVHEYVSKDPFAEKSGHPYGVKDRG